MIKIFCGFFALIFLTIFIFGFSKVVKNWKFYTTFDKIANFILLLVILIVICLMVIFIIYPEIIRAL